MTEKKKCTCTDESKSHVKCPVHGKKIKESHLSDILRIRNIVEEADIADQLIEEIGVEVFEDADLLKCVDNLIVERILAEDSTLLAQFGKDTKGRILAKYLHDKERISDRARLRNADLRRNTFDWKQFKIDPDNFLIIQGKDGWAAVRPDPAMVSRARALAAEKGKEVGNQNWIQYQVFYITDVKSRVQVQVHRTSRGGMIARRDPRAADTTISDFVADLVGRPFRAAYFLDERESGELDPRRLAGGRSARYGAGGASVERGKIQARAGLRAAGSGESMHKMLRRVMAMMPKIISYIRRMAGRKLDSESLEFEKIERDLEALMDPSNQEQLISRLRDEIEHAVSLVVDQLPQDQDPLLAVATNPSVLKQVIKNIADALLQRGLEGRSLL